MTQIITPLYPLGTLLIPAPGGEMLTAQGLPVTDWQEREGIFYYRLDDPTTQTYWPESDLIPAPEEPPEPESPPDDHQAPGPAQPAGSPPATTPAAFGAAVLAKLVNGQNVNGHVERLSEPWAELARAVEATPSKHERAVIFGNRVTGLPDGEAIRAAVFAADPGADLDSLWAALLESAAQAEETAEQTPADDGKDLLTDMGNSRRFARQHAGKVLYTESWGWMVWTGKKWEPDETGKVTRLARLTVKSLYRDAEAALDRAKAAIRAVEAAQEKGDDSAIQAAQAAKEHAVRRAAELLGWAIKTQGAARIEAILKLGKSEPEIATRVGEFDKNPWLLNCQNGVLDLKTGRLEAHDPGLKLTKITGAAYNPAAICPTWESFLNRIFSGNQEVIDFLQRAAGYSLTGDVGEQCLFFLYGVGANGKSTFANALQDMLGDYAMKTRAETLMIRKQDAIPEEVAQLAGVRFMLAAELGEGQRLNESLIKDLTGGDKLRARLLHKNSFEYYPIAKPWLYGNHKPIIRGTDTGIWRRPKLIPFEVTIPDSERDKSLPKKLRAELPGILAWAVRGCLAWQQYGLQTPASVTAATEEFRNEQDVLGAFLDDKCILNPLATVTAGELYTAYSEWAKDSGLEPLSKIAFSRQLTERGYRTAGRQPNGRAYYQGLGLLKDDSQG